MQPIRTVLCPIDFSPLAERALRLAVEMCRRTGARLVLQHNLDSRPPSYLTVRWMWAEDHESDDREWEERVPDLIREWFKKIPEGISYEAKLTRGPLDAGLLEVAKRLPADAIVLGTHGPSGAEHQSLTERVIIQAPCPVLVLGESYRPEAVFDKHDQPPEEMSVLVPYNFAAHSQMGLDFALALARYMPHKIQLLHVVPPKLTATSDSQVYGPRVDDTRAQLDKLVPDRLAARVTVKVAVGEPVSAILSSAEELNALFIVMGAHGKSAFKRFLFGATTLSVLHRSACPVLFVPPAVKRIPEWSAA